MHLCFPFIVVQDLRATSGCLPWRNGFNVGTLLLNWNVFCPKFLSFCLACSASGACPLWLCSSLMVWQHLTVYIHGCNGALSSWLCTIALGLACGLLMCLLVLTRHLLRHVRMSTILCFLPLPACMPSGNVGREPSCVVISGPGVSASSTVHELLMRCRHRAYVVRSKLALEDLWVQFRSHQQAKRVHSDLRHFALMSGSPFTCDIVPDHFWPQLPLMRGKPGGSRHRGHGHGSGSPPSLAFFLGNYSILVSSFCLLLSFRRSVWR